jgi:HAD superfamily hydrolase (TIGR01549 family)
MAIRAVFFDVVGTLARFVPEQEELLVEAAATQGVPLSIDAARKGFAAAGEWWNRVVGQRYRQLGRAEQGALNLEYDRRLFSGAELDVSVEQLSEVFREMLRRGRPSRLQAYDDAPAALDAVRRKGLIVGVISNMGRDLPQVLEEVRLRGFLEVAVSSGEVGVSKPDRRIFQEAARRAGLSTGEAMYVGDLYDSDVVGARNAGMTAVLLDRYGIFGEYRDCLRIAALSEVSGLVERE